MTFNEYQIKSKETAKFPDKENIFIFATLGMMGEAGEVSEKIKKVWRDKNKVFNEEDREEIKKELGDVLWYMSQLASEIGIELDDVATNNINKTQSRIARNVLHGSGDNR